MLREGRILIVDDLEQWRKQLTEMLEHDGFMAYAVSTSQEVLAELEKNLYHILLLDIRLDSNDPKNVDGITLLAELDKRGLSKAIKVITISAFGSKKQVRTLFKDYEVADCLFKSTLKKETFLENVQQVLSQQVDVNLDLQIHWQPRSNPEQAVLDFDVNGTRIQQGTELQKRIALELDDLLCRLFSNAESIMISPLSPGWSGARVLRIRPFYHLEGGGHEVIVKFGDANRIEEEYAHFKQYIGPFLGGSRTTTVLAVRYTSHLGGIIYSLIGTPHDAVVDFADFYRAAEVPQIIKALDGLFRYTCGNWYASRGNLRPLDLSAEYAQWCHFSPERLARVVAEQLKSVEGDSALLFKNLKSERAFTNPLGVIAGQTLMRPSYSCTTHGDFNARNLLVDSGGHVWLIDFQHTGQSHILRDVAILDAVLRFELLGSEEATLEERLQMEEALCRVQHFSQVKQLATAFSTQNAALAKVYAVVVHLRTIARNLVAQNPADDISEYYIALLYTALNSVRFRSLSERQREHALLSASLLADGIGLSTRSNN